MRRYNFNPITEYSSLRQEEVRSGKDKQAEQEFFETRWTQRESIATLGGLLIETVTKNPDTPEEELLDLVKEYSESSQLADYQKALFIKTIKEFLQRRRKIKDLLEKYPNPADLVYKIFYKKPKQDVVMERRPFVLHIILCDADYDAITGESKSDSKGISGGQYLPSTETSRGNTKGIISIGRQYGYPETNGRIATHEETHAIFDLLSSQTKTHEVFAGCHSRPADQVEINRLFEDIARTKRHGSKEHYSYNFWQEQMTQHTESIKNEIYAYMREGAKGVTKTLSKPKSEKGLYDYFATTRTTLLEMAWKELSTEDFEIFHRCTEHFFIDKYSVIIRNALEAINTLMTDCVFTIEQAMIFLLDIPLLDWKKEVQRNPFKK